eukprot:gnl/Dysnectes_brevis/6913_a11117_406.p1 GENE.gnl/Dysnectes_brevis/6913_a11117_406~~gnl/Dysnectes_brevis/6913_a11117_406.p1  ORF type:complete len:333 (+),score=3.27 gnl/Dysnectes_brevis/6913_a11117_406:79-999(+)
MGSKEAKLFFSFLICRLYAHLATELLSDIPLRESGLLGAAQRCQSMLISSENGSPKRDEAIFVTVERFSRKPGFEMKLAAILKYIDFEDESDMQGEIPKVEASIIHRRRPPTHGRKPRTQHPICRVDQSFLPLMHSLDTHQGVDSHQSSFEPLLHSQSNPQYDEHVEQSKDLVQDPESETIIDAYLGDFIAGETGGGNLDVSSNTEKYVKLRKQTHVKAEQKHYEASRFADTSAVSAQESQQVDPSILAHPVSVDAYPTPQSGAGGDDQPLTEGIEMTVDLLGQAPSDLPASILSSECFGNCGFDN